MPKLSRLRVGFQVFLHVVLVTHVVAYYYFDWRAVGGVDFQDFFYNFLGQGLVTAAVIFTGAVYLLSFVFGRLFCSWGCHFGATQDFAAWLLRRCGWTAPVVRTRFLHWGPYLLLAFVFIWPNVERALASGWRFRGVDLAGAGPWERLPGLALSVVTFAACGAGILLFLGRRGFCRFVCPYGAIFRLTETVSPYRIRRVATCSSACAEGDVHPCTAACPTAIDVHAETSRAGRVTSLDCVRCHLCVEACPSAALSYSLPRRDANAGASSFRELPVIAAPPSPGGSVATAGDERRYSLTLSEEVMVFLVAVASFAVTDLVFGGHFLSATIALGEAFLALVVWRLLRGREVGVLGLRLRRGERWSLTAITLVGGFLLTLVPHYDALAFKVLRFQAVERCEAAGIEPRRALPADPVDLEARQKALLGEAAGKLEAALRHVPSSLECRELLCCVRVLLGDGAGALDAAHEIARRRDQDEESLERLRQVCLRFGEVELLEVLDRQLEELRLRSVKTPPEGPGRKPER